MSFAYFSIEIFYRSSQEDIFEIRTSSLGELQKIKIRHDNSGMLNNWLLQKVEIKDGTQIYVFHCDQWLTKNKTDSKLERILYEKVTKFEYIFCIHQHDNVFFSFS